MSRAITTAASSQPAEDRETLADATALGDPACYSSTPGEFAARWNARSHEERVEWLRVMVEAMQALAARSSQPAPSERLAHALAEVTAQSGGDARAIVAAATALTAPTVTASEPSSRQDAEGALREAMTDVLAVAEVPDEDAPVALLESLRSLGWVLVAAPAVSAEQVGHFLSEWLDDYAPLNEQRYVRAADALSRRYPTLRFEAKP